VQQVGNKYCIKMCAFTHSLTYSSRLIHSFIHSSKHACTHTHQIIHTHVHIYIYMQTSVHTHTYIYIYYIYNMQTRVHTHTHTHWRSQPDMTRGEVNYRASCAQKWMRTQKQGPVRSNTAICLTGNCLVIIKLFLKSSVHKRAVVNLTTKERCHSFTLGCLIKE
jgi:hypothetical protein